ncbi:MAG: oligopeptide transporter, OPT family [Dysgonamonadaceae bacterium]|jgi:putative OPT family oligopeptide transporter|nr:oligopeptide transporter, OPT family [Dysgonamonadaceae bacterium]
MSAENEKMTKLPDNAFHELKPGETYHPIMPSTKTFPEVTVWSVTWGLLMAVLFSAAAAYLGLKVGQVFEAAIPIAIIAVGLSSSSKRKNALGENVIIQSIGASSGVIVAGAIFTLPALYILQAKYPELTVNFMQIFLSSLLGGCLGILFLIPFRKYFVADMHGKYPFPEATATTQVLISGEKAGNQAKPLIIAGLIGGIYDFVVATFGWWNETVTTRVVAVGDVVAEKFKLVFKLNTGAALLGLGYIIGLRYTFITCAGSFLIWFVVIPLMSAFFGDQVLNQWNGNIDVAVGSMAAEDIFRNYARHIGIGGIAMAGIIGIFNSRKIIRSAVGLASKEFKHKDRKVSEAALRTQRDLSMKFISIASLVTLILIFVFFYFGIIHNLLYVLVGWFLVSVIAFLFTTVAANAIAIVGTNPVSGMTLMTLILASVVLVTIGLKGTSGMMAALIMGGVVCTALSMAGGFITDLKIGYWLGSTPAKQESWKFLGTLISAITVGGVMIILNKTYGFTSGQLAAPQANAMAAVIEPLMLGTGAPWMLYGIGALIAVTLTLFRIPALAFALGMFIPLELNTPLLLGGIISWYVNSRSKNPALNKARSEKGTLLASGFIAGGALMGVVSAIIKFLQSQKIDKEIFSLGAAATPDRVEAIHRQYSFINNEWLTSNGAVWVAILMLGLLCAYLIWDSMRAKEES